MKIAIIGSSGEIGSRLAIHLIQNKYDVKLFSRNLGLRLSRIENVNFSSIDLLDKDKLHSLLKDIDCIVNCAIDKKEYATEDESVQKNKEAIGNLLEVAQANGVRKFIELSSVAVLPPRITNAIEKNPFIYSTENDWYTRAKIENEKLALEYKDKMNLSIIRAGIVYGPYLHWSKLAFIRTQGKTVILPNVHNSLCHAIHVDDLVGLIEHTINKTDSLSPQLIYGINPERVSWSDYYDTHGKSITMDQPTTQAIPLEEIQLMNKIDGDELRRPSFKRKFIDGLRGLIGLIPAPIKNLNIYKSSLYNLKAMNYGLINYDSYLNPKKTITYPKVYPNSFELELYQTDFIPNPNTDYTFKISISEGAKSASNWWLKSTSI
jgi:nucleoside-diphosphate-sugar epimerase